MNDQLKTRSRKLRKNSSDAEHRLWFLLRDRRFSKYKFRRQHVIPPFIVDFICKSQKLIIELDGGQHSIAREYDETRTKYLASKGFKVIRFGNDQVLKDKENVLEEIFRALNS